MNVRYYEDVYTGIIFTFELSYYNWLYFLEKQSLGESSLPGLKIVYLVLFPSDMFFWLFLLRYEIFNSVNNENQKETYQFWTSNSLQAWISSSRNLFFFFTKMLHNIVQFPNSVSQKMKRREPACNNSDLAKQTSLRWYRRNFKFRTNQFFTYRFLKGPLLYFSTNSLT